MQIYVNNEISINYACTRKMWDHKETIINDIFFFSLATEILNDDDLKPRSIDECQSRHDWSNWKKASLECLDLQS